MRDKLIYGVTIVTDSETYASEVGEFDSTSPYPYLKDWLELGKNREKLADHFTWLATACRERRGNF